ncbi:hypothetical protein SAMN05660909_02100 [Chitinophaga terrae (ex Kim and Jung 2007)]|uniref:Lipoprotein n=1 Tax=Chitinophaga terrae (ex Kim and Jung 2007) TaxID=408074 RepID=A0A1H4BJ32_9BACT|nr:hypothetical protein [Chitinophaga terrae (ex Kim and Jung 2007)]MDQ0109352.1 hypothetical protein [Chitinophaga terrae (ex Kim and Jung 2007)]GEP89592.1 hypothetical protein CTE07_12370 [Chitinophaga terrae (ex Kim and Jung 2007)]SEA48159.1 hypothetical protein SAMN05660909_02100 [Chitinophaga terrae (ex Kim and Jung 2007)]
MKKLLLLLFLSSGVLLACKKDKTGTKPEISFLRYSLPDIDSATERLDVVLRVKDGDGDIENSINWQIIFLQPPPTGPVDKYTEFKMPEIGANRGNSVNAEVTMRLISSDFKLWNEDKGAAPDSLWFKVFVLDNAGNSSDTILTPKISIIKSRR